MNNKKIALITLLALLISMLPLCALAQSSNSAKGFVKDEQGKPIVGATVEFLDMDSGRKVTIKTDKTGNYYSMGITPGRYKITLTSPEGQLLWYFTNRPIAVGENTVDFDLAKEKAEAMKAAGITEEQRKKMEAQQKEASKIKGLNEMLKQAQAARNTNNYEESAKILEQAVAQDQTHDIIFAQLADSYAGMQKYPEAEENYKKAISLAPNKGEYHNNLAQAYLKENKTPEAMAEYSKAAEIDPTHASLYYFNLGAVLTNKGQVDDAIVAFDKAIAADPTKADAYYWKGVNMLGKATVGKDNKMNAPAGTAEALNKYLELQPTGAYSQAAKDLLASIGAPVQTTFGSAKKGKK